MSDATDAVAEAKARWRTVAGKLLVRKDELEAELERLKGQEGTEERAREAMSELATVAGQLQTALDELKALDRLGGEARAGEARAIASSVLDRDPLVQTHEERALEGARSYLAELEGQARLNEELAAVDRELEGAGGAGGADEAAPVDKKKLLSREEADAQARAEFEALRSKKPKKTL